MAVYCQGGVQHHDVACQRGTSALGWPSSSQTLRRLTQMLAILSTRTISVTERFGTIISLISMMTCLMRSLKPRALAGGWWVGSSSSYSPSPLSGHAPHGRASAGTASAKPELLLDVNRCTSGRGGGVPVVATNRQGLRWHRQREAEVAAGRGQEIKSRTYAHRGTQPP